MNFSNSVGNTLSVFFNILGFLYDDILPSLITAAVQDDSDIFINAEVHILIYFNIIIATPVPMQTHTNILVKFLWAHLV